MHFTVKLKKEFFVFPHFHLSLLWKKNMKVHFLKMIKFHVEISLNKAIDCYINNIMNQ